MNDAEHNLDAAPPERIFLQYHGDGSADDGPVDHGNVTWCSDRIFDSDIEYRRIDADQSARIAELERRVEELTEEGVRWHQRLTLVCHAINGDREALEYLAKDADWLHAFKLADFERAKALRAQVETLTRERDEARAEADFRSGQILALRGQVNALRAAIDAARKEEA